MKMTPSWPHDNIQPLRRMFCFMLMLHKSSFEKACGNTIWCCSDEITTRQVQEDNLRKRPQMLCVSVVRSSEFELHCPRRSINEGSEIYSDKHQCLCTSCCGEDGWIGSSLQEAVMKGRRPSQFSSCTTVDVVMILRSFYDEVKALTVHLN